MSRSYCKPVRPYHLEYKTELNWRHRGITECDLWWENTFIRIDQKRWVYYTKKKASRYSSMRVLKYYRKHINDKRRRYDQNELRKELNTKNYEGLYSYWNCKDSDPEGYW